MAAGRIVSILLALTCALAGCGWTQFRGDAGHSGTEPNETTLSAQNVQNLSLAWSAPTGAPSGILPSLPVVGGGTVYTAVGGSAVLEAFDGSGSVNCSGSGTARTCTPVWTANLDGIVQNSPALADGMVFADGFTSGVAGTGALFAFDAAGSRGCSRSPKTCTPLWIGEVACCEMTAPAVVGNTVYVAASDGALAAFDVDGGTNCSGTAPMVCQPLWVRNLDVEVRNSAIAVANGRVYVAGIAARGTGEVEAFDTAGIATEPLWTATLVGPVNTSLVVVNGVLYLGTTERTLYAFDAAGSQNCSGDVGTHVCLSLWSAPTGDLITFDAPAVAVGSSTPAPTTGCSSSTLPV